MSLLELLRRERKPTKFEWVMLIVGTLVLVSVAMSVLVVVPSETGELYFPTSEEVKTFNKWLDDRVVECLEQVTNGELNYFKCDAETAKQYTHYDLGHSFVDGSFVCVICKEPYRRG